MSDEVTIKVGDRVRDVDGDAGTVLATHDMWVWVNVEFSGPSSYDTRDLTVIPPEPEPVSWRNVYGDIIGDEHHSRDGADEFAAHGRLGVVIGYDDGSHKLEVVS